MCHRILLLLTLLLLALPAPLAAQQPPPAWWYFAEVGEQLVAYTPDGASAEVLLASGLQEGGSGWRLGPASALAVLTVDGAAGLYHLTPQAARPLAFLPPEGQERPALSGPGDAQVLARSGPHLVLAGPWRLPSAPAYLVDLDAGTVEPLSGQVGTLQALGAWAVFSADGALLRYLARTGPDADRWTLIERTLATGQEQTRYTLEDALPLVSPDAHGERWLYRTPDSARRVTDRLIFADGSVQTLAEDIPAAEAPQRFLFQDSLVTYRTPCAEDCRLSLAPLDGGDPAHFPLPALEGPLQILHRLGQARLLAQTQDGPWLLEAGAEPVRLGFWSPLAGVVAVLAVSPDGRYVLAAADSPEQAAAYRVWDAQARQVVVQVHTGAEAAAFLDIVYDVGGFLLTRHPVGETTLYRYADGAAIPLPGGESRQFFAVPPDGVALLAQLRESAALERGIYRFDPLADAVQPLLAGGRPLPLRDAQ